MPITMRMRPAKVTTAKTATAIPMHFRISKIHSIRTVKGLLPRPLFTHASRTSFYRLASRPAAAVALCTSCSPALPPGPPADCLIAERAAVRGGHQWQNTLRARVRVPSGPGRRHHAARWDLELGESRHGARAGTGSDPLLGSQACLRAGRVANER